uniref:Uncharacterized protein n=1 Tax=Brassica campestris TaxID=3711 RepID=M4E3D5_BRACM
MRDLSENTEKPAIRMDRALSLPDLEFDDAAAMTTKPTKEQRQGMETSWTLDTLSIKQQRWRLEAMEEEEPQRLGEHGGKHSESTTRSHLGKIRERSIQDFVCFKKNWLSN